VVVFALLVRFDNICNVLLWEYSFALLLFLLELLLDLFQVVQLLLGDKHKGAFGATTSLSPFALGRLLARRNHLLALLLRLA